MPEPSPATPHTAATVTPTPSIGLASDEPATPSPAISPGPVDVPEDDPTPGVTWGDRPLADPLQVVEAGVESGAWTFEEGLVEALSVLVGEASDSDVVDAEMNADEATGLIEVAQSYAESGPDAVARDEVGRLLSRVLFDDERLRAMAGETTAARGDVVLAALPLGRTAAAAPDPETHGGREGDPHPVHPDPVEGG